MNGSAQIQVVATAGHVDHGKSSLILRLTGMDPDRFEEEKRRGLTIDLGFAWCTLPSGREIGFVDVPGHEKFVRNMLAGVGPVQVVLFVVASDEGWMPQSEEHFEIIRVLGVRDAVFALTKSDLVDGTTLDSREKEIRERLAGTALENSTIVACSNETGEGLDELSTALDQLISSAPLAPDSQDRPRLFVDRVFSVKGSGTVVTGTLTDGYLSVGDAIELLPSGARARIRGLQTHKREIGRAQSVSRVAVNLSGIEREDIGRGDALARVGQRRATDRIDGVVDPIRGVKTLTERGAFKLYAGTAERDAQVRFYDSNDRAGDERFARIRLAAPLPLDVFDLFVLRDSGRQRTVAGGRVLDAEPRLRPGPDAAKRLRARESSTRADLPALLLKERGAVHSSSLSVLAGRTTHDIPDAVQAGNWWIGEALLARTEHEVEAALEQFHREHPLKHGADLTLLRAAVSDSLARNRVPADPDLIDALLSRLESNGMMARAGSTVRTASHSSPVGGEDVERLIRAVAESDGTPPTVPELVERQGFSRELIEVAVSDETLVNVSPDIVMTPEFVDRARKLVESEPQGITVSAFRERLATSRKYALPLLEYFDRKGVTRREGDLRMPRQS
ncbi:MAG: selenocysteine-specific translation elongation factor [Actinomycetota bacterium]